jgi:uracil-DNA glycosylase family 4
VVETSCRNNNKRLLACRRCPRLVAHIAVTKSKVPTHHNAPVPAWGVQRPHLLIVGLAPGAQGANRTGKGFVGDSSAEFLFAALTATGFASHKDASRARLKAARITNIVKCLPPGNRPVAAEVNNCRDHLVTELAEFWSPAMRMPRVVLALGGVAHGVLCRTFANEFGLNSKAINFSHGSCERLANTLWLLASFHPSRINTQTRRLTPDMLADVLGFARKILGPKIPS